MKARNCILLAAIIILALLGWWNQGELSALRESRDLLSARAEKLGIPAETTYPKKRPRPDRAAEARLAAAIFIKLHKRREAIRLAGGDPEASRETSANVFRKSLRPLDSKQIRVVIGEILGDPELDGRSRRKLIGQSLGFLAEKNPGAVLSLFSEFSPHLKDTGIGRQVVQKALGNLAEENPQAAYAWARTHAKEHPGIIARVKSTLVSATALRDPALAFEIVRELGSPNNADFAAASILRQPDHKLRSEAFEAFRGHLASLDHNERRDVESRAWQTFAGQIAEDGFEKGSKWLLSVKPTPEELASVIRRMGSGLANSRRSEESALWMEWIAENLPAGTRNDHIARLMEQWTYSDYESAGKWLASAPGSPAKNAAIRGYAETVFKHDPETAMLWINSLPPGEERRQTLRFILENKLRDDPEAAAAFAKEHEIDK